MNNKSSHLSTNILTYALLQVVNLLVGIIIPRYILRIFGSEINGIINTINGFTTFFAYVEAGIGLSLIHSLYRPLAENDTNGVSRIVSFSKKKYYQIGGIYLALIVILSLLYPLLNPADSVEIKEFIGLIFVIGLYGTFDFLSIAKYRVLLTADRKEYIISLAMIAAQLMRFAVFLVAIRLGAGIIIIKLIPILTLFMRSLLLRLYVKKRYPDVSFRYSSAETTKGAEDHWSALLFQIAINFSAFLPPILISSLMDYENVSVYSVYNLIVSSLISLVSALSSGISPMLGQKISSGNEIEKDYNLFEWFTVCCLSIAFSTGLLMIEPFVALYTDGVTDIHYNNSLYAVLFVVWAALYVVRMPYVAVINATGTYDKTTKSNIISLGIQIVGGGILTYFFGIYGVLVSLIAAAIHRDIFMLRLNYAGSLSSGKARSFRRLAVMIAFLLGNALLLPLINRLSIISLGLWLLAAVITVVAETVLVLVLSFAFDKKELSECILLLKQKFSRFS